MIVRKMFSNYLMRLTARYFRCFLPLIFLFLPPDIFALDPHQELRLYAHEVWRTEEGLPQNTVNKVIQTRDGYLWIATEEGLVRFDGKRFTVFDKENTAAITSNSIRNLYEDRGGALWLTTARELIRRDKGVLKAFSSEDGLPHDAQVSSFYEDGANVLWLASGKGLVRFREEKFTAFTARDGLASDLVEAVAADRAGVLWVGTAGGLTRYKDQRFTSYKVEDGLAHNGVRALHADRDGGLWIGTRGGLTRLKDGRFSTYTTRDGLPINNIEMLYGCRDGKLLIGTLGGLAVWRNNVFTSYTTEQALPNNRVEEIFEDREGSIWIGTEGGLSRLRDERLESFTTIEGLSSNIVRCVTEDREGNLWIGTENGGLNALKDKKFTAYTTEEGLSADLVRAIYQDRRGQLWLGTHEGGLNLLKNGKFTHFTTKDGLASNIVLAVYDDRHNNLWVGTPDGLSLYRDGAFTTYTSANGLANDFVRSIYEDREGRLWIGTRGGLSVFQDGKFTSYTTLDGLPNDFIGAVLEDRQGNFWIGTLNGLCRFADGEFTTYTTRDGLSSNVVTALYEGVDGELWIGTNGGGLNLLKNGRFTNFGTGDGLFNDVIYRILSDDSGNLWMSCNKGIFRVSREELLAFSEGKRERVTSVSYGTADGMKTRECSGGGHPAGWKTGDGRLWFSTIKGAVMIDPENIRINKQAPPVAIETVMVDGEAYDSFQKATLPAGRTSFAFGFAGLSFVAPEKVTYKYKLEGFDRDWVEAGTRREAFYTNIPPGDYRFRVTAANNDGVWNETGAAFNFRLNPHFYQTYWFYLLCAAATGFIAWQLYLMRVRRMREQFSAVLQERNRIAREIHDTLAQGFAGISVQLELVARMIRASAQEAAQTHLDQARILVRTSLAEARRSVWDLRSQALESGGLPEALSETIAQLTAGTSVPAKVEVSGASRALSPVVENNLLRIGQEAVTNAIKHARAQHILVTLSFNPTRVRLAVRDDGSGFAARNPQQPSATHGHFGLFGMRERAEQIGGKLIINSAPGAGTEIIVDVELGD